MLKMSEIAEAVRRMALVGSVMLVGVASSERVMAAGVDETEVKVQRALPATADAAVGEAGVGVKVVPPRARMRSS